MPKRTSPVESALYVKLPTAAVGKLDRAAEALGVRKKDLVAGLVSKYVDPDSRQGLAALGSLATRKVSVDFGEPAATMGSYSFQAYELPEVMNAEQAGHFLQIDEAAVIAMAERKELPARKLGEVWRFSRSALVNWLSGPAEGDAEASGNRDRR